MALAIFNRAPLKSHREPGAIHMPWFAEILR
jgi:hypothetical protein